ncbi:MAG: sulfite exporter TauE/SafE family protein [Saprospiraceae bacterium]|nr:sulfite exporter TauE/SafE family protein [Saprospiraceae bacterium]
MDLTLYWFMFPIGILVATIAMLSGIAGAALFMPFFLLVLPILGNEYELASPVTAIAAALITCTFGFASGFVGYFRKKLIDFDQGWKFLRFSIPLAILGALICPMIDENYIRGLYGALMLVLAWILLKKDIAGSESLTVASAETPNSKTKVSSDGKMYSYFPYSIQKIPTIAGGFLTGLLSTGIGEMVMPQLIKGGKFPVPVAAATSVIVVSLTFLFASGTHIYILINEGGAQAIPWHLVIYTIPGVLIGGQLGPALQGKISRTKMIRGISIVFIVIGIAMGITFIQSFR